jgi:hypothetical protein
LRRDVQQILPFFQNRGYDWKSRSSSRRQPQAEKRGRNEKAIKSLKINDPAKPIDFAPKDFNDLPRPNEAVRFARRKNLASPVAGEPRMMRSGHSLSAITGDEAGADD